MRQIAANPRVALCVGTYEIEGIASAQGSPLLAENAFFARLYQERHPNSFKMYSALPDEVVVQVKIQRIRQWQYIDGKPFLAATVVAN